MHALVADLAAESVELDASLDGLDEADWERATPAAGWAIRDQVSHLAYFDETAVLAATDAERFRAEAAALREEGDDFPDRVAQRYRSMPAPELSAWFRTARATLLRTFDAVEPGARLPWYGPDMSAASAVSARLMETWAHGQDIADALGIAREPTARMRSVAHLGVSTLGFVYQLNGLAPPQVPIRVELSAPDGDRWTWGPPDASERVAGRALDFCLAVTQRRHVDDTDLHITGPHARQWMSIAQAFAGAPGQGRRPGQFPKGGQP